jgi:hypothetical protein
MIVEAVIEVEETEALAIIGVEVEAVIEVEVVEVTEALMDQGKCIKQLAQNVSLNVKFRLNQMVKNQFIAEIALTRDN